MKNVSIASLFATLLVGTLILGAAGSHIDDIDGELSKFSFDSVIFRLQKDCSLDRIPDVRIYRKA